MFFASIILIAYLAWLAVGTDGNDRVLVPYLEKKRMGDCRVILLKSWANRRVGLTNHIQIPRSCGVLILRTRGIHTYGMAFPIDVVVLNAEHKIVDIFYRVEPARKLKFGGQRLVLELGPGVADQWRLAIGAHLEFADV